MSKIFLPQFMRKNSVLEGPTFETTPGLQLDGCSTEAQDAPIPLSTMSAPEGFRDFGLVDPGVRGVGQPMENNIGALVDIRYECQDCKSRGVSNNFCAGCRNLHDAHTLVAISCLVSDEEQSGQEIRTGDDSHHRGNAAFDTQDDDPDQSRIGDNSGQGASDGDSTYDDGSESGVADDGGFEDEALANDGSDAANSEHGGSDNWRPAHKRGVGRAGARDHGSSNASHHTNPRSGTTTGKEVAAPSRTVSRSVLQEKRRNEIPGPAVSSQAFIGHMEESMTIQVERAVRSAIGNIVPEAVEFLRQEAAPYTTHQDQSTADLKELLDFDIDLAIAEYPGDASPSTTEARTQTGARRLWLEEDRHRLRELKGENYPPFNILIDGTAFLNRTAAARMRYDAYASWGRFQSGAGGVGHCSSRKPCSPRARGFAKRLLDLIELLQRLPFLRGEFRLELRPLDLERILYCLLYRGFDIFLGNGSALCLVKTGSDLSQVVAHP
ncbi:hypothetical protein PG994_004225 [Apiospora phragmitis]|uniref:Uncharacterized protein n=1 Tax=Apiospora phragmitis TaxID=2905665 RepID=A0ABR1VSN9_9PEZI